MNRRDFGKLVAALRQDQGWTQVQLADFVEIELDMLSNIERGAKKHLDPGLLYRLASVLQLASLERQEFFLAASGLEQEQIVRHANMPWSGSLSTPGTTLERLIGMMSQMTVPAVLTDVYGDILALNPSIFNLYSIDLSLVQTAAQSPFGFNFIYFLYGLAANSPSFGENFSESAFQFLRAFRQGTMRYRIFPRYRALMTEMRDVKKYPLFDLHWRRVSALETDKESMLDSYEIRHPNYGALRVITTASVTTSPHGELYLNHYTPMDRHTAASFLDIYDRVGGGAMRLSPWPRND